MKKQALLRKLPDLVEKVKQLEKRIRELEDTCDGKHP
jgi:hypothetical protein